MCHSKLGNFRSPEEYSKSSLTEKVDIYSVGHVLYGILMGRNPVYKKPGYAKKKVSAGEKPVVLDEAIQGDEDKALVSVLNNVYDPNPDNRYSAAEIISKFEHFIDKSYNRRLRHK